MRKIKLFLKFINPITYLLKIGKRNAGIAVASLLFVVIAGYIFREKIPFFASAGNDPVAYWNLDEGTGGTAYDFIGSNDGTLASGTGAPSWVSGDQCITGKCLQFDGTADYVSITDSASLDQASSFTISVWFKATSFPGNGNFDNLISKDNTVSFNESNYYLELADSDEVDCGFYGNGDYRTHTTTNANLITNTWYHFTCAFDNTNNTVTIYINGSQIYTATENNSPNTNDYPLYIGTLGNNDQYFKGYIDEVKIYNYTRSASQIKADYAARGGVKGAAARFGDADVSRSITDGLVGYWNMDAGTGTTVTDLSGNNKTGSLGAGNSAPTWASGKYGSALQFDGTNDYVGFDSSVDPVTGGNPRTISAWVYSTAQSAALVSWGSYSTGQAMELSTNGNGDIAVQFYNASIVDDDGVSVTNQWTHVVATCSGNTVNTCSLWKNGQLAETSTNTTTINTAANGSLKFGLPVSGSASILKGSLDEVRIYNRALDASEIKALYEWAPGPVGYWNMDEVNGSSTLIDSSGNTNTCTLSSMPSNPWVTGKFGKALDFQKTDDLANCGSNASLDQLQAMTVSAWIKPRTSSSYEQIIAKATSANPDNGWLFESNMANNTLEFWLDTSNQTLLRISSDNVITDNQWQYITLTWDGSLNATGIKMYVNGIEVTYATSTNGSGSRSSDASADLTIGNDINVGDDFDGLIDDVKIYNYIRTSSQIVEDMNGGHPAVGTPVGSTVLHLKMDEGYGSTTQDWSPQNNDASLGTGTSAPTWTNEGKFKKALSFDGTSDYLSMPDSSSLDFNDQDFSISGWFYRDTANTDDMILAKRNGNAAGNQGYMVWVDDTTDKIDFEISDSVDEYDMLSSSTFTTPGWNHFVVVWDDDNAENSEIYVNGKDDDAVDTGTIANIGDLSNGNQLHLGNVSDNVSALNVDYFDGKLDEIKIYPFALTPDQVKIDYNQGKVQTLGARSTGVGGTAPDNSASRAYCVPGDSSVCNPPVAEWRLEQNSGTSAYDSSGNGTTASVQNGATWSTGKYGNALSFDGDNDRLDTNYTTNLTSEITISAWVYLTSSSCQFNRCVIMDKVRAGTFEIEYNLEYDSSNTSLVFNRGFATSNGEWWVSSPLSLNTWYHIVVTYDASSTSNDPKIYVNGRSFSVTEDSAPSGAVRSESTSFIVGDNRAGNIPWFGKIDEVRIYNYVRTSAQIAWEYNKGEPVAYYKLNECTGTTASDWSENANGVAGGNNGTISIGSTGSQTSAGTCASGNTAHAWNNGTTGKYGGSLNFDNSDDYVTVADNSVFDFPEGSDFSISAWIKPTLNDNNAIFAKKAGNGTGAAGYMTYVNAAGKIATYIADGTSGGSDGINLFTDRTVSSGTWSHIVIVYQDDTSFKTYINGQDAGGTVSGTIANVDDVANGIAFAIGAESDRDMVMEGQIDEVKVFNYALTPTQIKTVYAGSAVGFQ